MGNRDDYGLGADIQRLLAYGRRMNRKLDQIIAGQATDQQLAELIVQLDSITKQLRRTVNPKE
jgi:uncharacterized protein YebE (UPF0316 family)